MLQSEKAANILKNSIAPFDLYRSLYNFSPTLILGVGIEFSDLSLSALMEDLEFRKNLLEAVADQPEARPPDLKATR